LVSQRQDNLTGKRVETAFLRLRLRYTEVTPDLGSWAHLLRPVLSFLRQPKSFEFECDLGDLDFLQQRLDEARQMLIIASSVKEVGDETK